MEGRLNWLELGLVTVGMAGLGAIVGTTLNSSGLVGFKIPSWVPVAVFASFFLSGRIWFEKSRGNIRQRKAFYLTLVAVAALALVSIPFLFWGVFLKLIDLAGKGGATL
jgi:hypothetical protein